jgi:hypothetical protein
MALVVSEYRAHMARVAKDSVAAAHLAERVHVVADDYVKRVGKILQLGREELGRKGYEKLVAERLPFNIATADRYRAVHLATLHLPDAPLPSPHRALYAIGHGDLPEQRESPSRCADELVAELVRHDAAEVTPRLRVIIEAWLVSGH